MSDEAEDAMRFARKLAASIHDDLVWLGNQTEVSQTITDIQLADRSFTVTIADAEHPTPEICSANEALHAENARLRVALQGISDFGERHPGHGYSCHLLARAALGDSHD